MTQACVAVAIASTRSAVITASALRDMNSCQAATPAKARTGSVSVLKFL